MTSEKLFEPIQPQTKPNQNQKYSQNHGFDQFLTESVMLGMKKQVFKLENSMVASYKSFECFETKPN